MNITMTKITRGDIFYVDFGKPNNNGSCIQSGKRPVINIQSEAGNKYSTTCVVVPISRKMKSHLPMHVRITNRDLVYGRVQNSYALTEQIRVIDKQDLKEKVGKISSEKIKEIERALKVALQLSL